VQTSVIASPPVGRPRSARQADAGFSLIESLIALVLMLVVTSAAFTLVNTGTTASQTQPEVLDMQQRARVASDLLFRDLFMAGAGVYAGPQTGALNSFFPPIVPRRLGLWGDAYNVVNSDAATISYIPNTYSQTTIRDPMPISSEELKVEDMPNCPKGKKLCGFESGMVLIIFDDLGHFDFFTVTEVQDSAAHIQHRQQDLSYPYQPGAIVTQAESHTYYFDQANRQLRHYDGYMTDVPVVDNVVGVLFEYFGDPDPPISPKPPSGVANCLYDAAGNLAGGLATLSTQGASLAELPLAMLNDGPWCGGGQNRFDADLLRVKQVRVTLRMQTGNAAFRATGADYAVAGRSREALRNIADYTVQFEVSPRNMNLGR
jgi:prepilin-type N-terminal cleavage/methylation domain-containing protein